MEFLQKYAQQRGLTAAEVVAGYLHRLKSGAQPAVHPEVAALTGLVPQDAEAEAEYRRHLLEKHG